MPRPTDAVVEDDVTFYVMLRQRNLEALETTLLDGVLLPSLLCAPAPTADARSPQSPTRCRPTTART